MTNDLPSWVPIFNTVVAAVALVLAVPGLRSLGWIAAYRAALAVALVILLSGALFQSNIMPLWLWVIVGSGGRLVLLAIVVAGTVVAWSGHRRSPPATNLDDIATQLHDIQRQAAASSAHAEAAYAAASDADDRVISQFERAVEDRERVVRIEDVSTDTNERAQDIQGRMNGGQR